MAEKAISLSKQVGELAGRVKMLEAKLGTTRGPYTRDKNIE